MFFNVYYHIPQLFYPYSSLTYLYPHSFFTISSGCNLFFFNSLFLMPRKAPKGCERKWSISEAPAEETGGATRREFRLALNSGSPNCRLQSGGKPPRRSKAHDNPLSVKQVGNFCAKRRRLSLVRKGVVVRASAPTGLRYRVKIASSDFRQHVRESGLKSML